MSERAPKPAESPDSLEKADERTPKEWREKIRKLVERLPNQDVLK